MDLIARLWQPIWMILQIVLQIGLLTAFIYVALLFLKGTRAAPMLLGIVIVTLLGWFLTQSLGLEEMEWLLAKVPALMAFGLIIIFAPELRRAFAEIGSNHYRLWRGEERRAEVVDALIDAAYELSSKRIGALIAVERDIGMRAITEAGTQINAPVRTELLVTIFYPNTPLHDGAVVIRNGIILSAGCFFPLTQSQISRSLGTRHRAAIGITEETDAVVVIVSEETGAVSLAHKGRLVRDIGKDRLRRHLNNYLVKQTTTAKGSGALSKGVDELKNAVVHSQTEDAPAE